MGIIPPCITEHHTTKIYGVAEWSALPWYRWHIMLGGCQSQSGCCGDNYLCPCCITATHIYVCPACRLVTVLAEPSELSICN